MWCDSCVYYQKPPAAAVCRPCGRYISNKYGQLIVTALLALALGVFSHYILTGRALTGSRLVWIHTALAFPCSIYSCPYYFASAALTLAGLVAIPIIVTFYFGIWPGMIVGFLAGAASGVHMGGLIFPALAAFAVGRRVRQVPAEVWAILASFGGALYYLYLARRFGPGPGLYSDGLGLFMLWVAALVVVTVAAAVVLGTALRHRSVVALAVAAVLALSPALVFFRWVGPERLEASSILYMYAPSRILNADLPPGFVTGTGDERLYTLAQERQLGHLFDTIKYAEATRARAIAACDAYLGRYAVSGDAADVLMLKATMLNARVDLARLRLDSRLETYYDRVSRQSLPVYSDVIQRWPESPQAALARYLLAEGTFESGDVAQAQKLFSQAERALEALVPADYVPSSAAPETARDLFRAAATDTTESDATLHAALLETRRRLSLIAANSDFGGQPLARFAALDPRDESFPAEAARLVTAYRDSRIVDNVRLALAERLADPVERRATLRSLLDIYPESDVRDRMLLSAARAEMAANIGGDAPKRAELLVRRLVSDYPSSTWRIAARELLAKITRARTPAAANPA